MHKTLSLLFAVLSLCDSVRATDDYKPGPDSLPQPGVPKGELVKGTFEQSKVFPGTVRDYTVYLPALVGVFVQHGRVKASSTNALDRFNRSSEYDGLGGDYAKFLLDELLPFIEAKHGVKLSKNGTDRAIGGASSGAIAAASSRRPKGMAVRPRVKVGCPLTAASRRHGVTGRRLVFPPARGTRATSPPARP